MSLVDEDLLEHTISGPNTASHGQMNEGDTQMQQLTKLYNLLNIIDFYCEVVSQA